MKYHVYRNTPEGLVLVETVYSMSKAVKIFAGVYAGTIVDSDGATIKQKNL